MKVLMIGDVVGSIGCDFLARKLPALKREHQVDITVVNGENSADGNGITAASARSLYQAGADIITTGNHAFQRRNELHLFEDANILRPANYPDACPGHGYTVYDMGSSRAAFVNLQGVLFMEPLANPFDTMDRILKALDTPNIFVDLHAEATSEKRALAHYLTGKVTAVIGTHTHVPTADASILGSHTAYLTDVGMTGAEDSVLGVNKAIAIDKLRLHLPVAFKEAEGPCWLCGVLIEYDKRCGKCTNLKSLIVR